MSDPVLFQRNIRRHHVDADQLRHGWLCGPTGVGKTTIGKMVETLIIQKEMKELERDPEYVPVVRISAAQPAEGKSLWKEVFASILLGFDDVLVYRKSLAATKGSTTIGKVSTEETTTAQRQAVRNQIRERRTIIVIIDECQHLLQPGQGRTIKQNMDVLKSLSTETGVVFLLIGPYQLPMLLRLEGQLIRRSKSIHFIAYGNSLEDTKSFLRAAKKIAKTLPLPFEVIPEDFLIQSTLRYMGLLRDLLVSGTIRALAKGKATVGLVELQESARSAAELQKLLQEQKVGEDFMAGRLNGVAELRAALGLPPAKKKKAPKPRGRKTPPGIRKSRHEPLLSPA
jgi:hypothetical protein